jgi:hypothetical protein
MSVIGAVLFFCMLFAQKRATLRGSESEDRDSNALINSRQSTTSNFRSSIKFLATILADCRRPKHNA